MFPLGFYLGFNNRSHSGVPFKASIAIFSYSLILFLSLLLGTDLQKAFSESCCLPTGFNQQQISECISLQMHEEYGKKEWGTRGDLKLVRHGWNLE